MIPFALRTLALSCLLAGSALAAAGEKHWTQFRGNRGDGSTLANGLPLHWSDTRNIAWKTPVHGRAWSSPVIYDQTIWITTASEDGRALSLLSVNGKTGAIVSDRKLFDVVQPQFAHKFNTYASPTPVVEKGFVYVSFGSPGIACVDTKSGRVVWERRDFICNHFRGAGSSPILHGNLLIHHFDGSDHQFVAALDKRTGKTVWESRRSIDFKDLGPDGKPEAEGDWRKAYSTPHIEMLNGKAQLISQGAKAAYGYDPKTGRELWRIEERTSHSASSRPAVGHGLIFIPSGWSTGQLLAVRPGAKGEVLDVNAADAEQPREGLNLVWRIKRNVPRKPSVTLDGDFLYWIDDGGIAVCVDAKSGQERWRERIGGNYSASPLLAPGRLYFFSEEGKATVIAAQPRFEKLAENSLPDGFMASPAVLGHALILRTKTALYRIEEGARLVSRR
ncbi:MAG: quinonprotein alcohol dehydrogenase [Verrucomicrobia bacterium]|nr:quinonprotein alcohol dehydrogenase [Verrucomicrobiota bacterium]